MRPVEIVIVNSIFLSLMILGNPFVVFYFKRTFCYSLARRFEYDRTKWTKRWDKRIEGHVKNCDRNIAVTLTRLTSQG